MSYEIADTLSPFVPKVEFKLIPIKNLVSNQDYQRGLSENHILKAAENFDVRQINPVKVSHRDGQYYVINGQHTIEIVALVSNSRETPVWCMIYEEELSYQTEAQIFADQQKYVKALVPIETFKAHLEAGNEKQLTIQQIVHSYDLEIGATNNNTATICAVSALEYIYDKYGVHALDRTIRMCVSTWEGEANSFSANIIKAIAMLINTYKEALREDVFKEKLGQVSIKTLTRQAKERANGCLGYAEIMLKVYNAKSSKNKLQQDRLYSGRKRRRRQLFEEIDMAPEDEAV